MPPPKIISTSETVKLIRAELTALDPHKPFDIRVKRVPDCTYIDIYWERDWPSEPSYAIPISDICEKFRGREHGGWDAPLIIRKSANGETFRYDNDSILAFEGLKKAELETWEMPDQVYSLNYQPPLFEV